MFSVRYLIQCTLAACLLLLPIAHLKLTVAGIPLYSVEIPVLLALSAYAYGWKRRVFDTWGAIDFRNPLVVGSILFLVGALFSFFLAPFSLAGLGMLKTWFVVPLVALWLWLETKPNTQDLEQMLLFWLAMSVFSASASLAFFMQGALTHDGRLEAWYASPNYLAFLLAPGVLLASHFLSASWAAQRRFTRLLLWLSVIILSSAIFLIRSYEVWAGIFMALSIYFLLTWSVFPSWPKKIASVAIVAGVACLFVFFESGSEKWQSLMELSPRSSLASRIMIWEAAVRILSDHPVAGIGIGRFQEAYLAYQRYFPPYLEWAVPQPHNLYLAVWLQTGVIGLFGFFVLVVGWFQKMSALLSSHVPIGAIRTGALLLSLLSLLLIIGLVDTPFFKTDLAFVFWLIIAFGAGLLNAQKNR